MIFYLGTHKPSFLGRTDVPLFISRRTLERQKTWKRATGRWALDSGGFTEISTYGKFQLSPEAYVDQVYQFDDAIGPMDWAAPQDWMVEPWIVQRTGLSVREHQERTIDNYLDLIARSDLFIPVLQGWTLADYMRHIVMYKQAGVDLTTLETVGVGSVCRRQNTQEAATIFRTLSSVGIPIHGFGVKTSGYKVYGDYLHSADSMAWSYAARKRQLKLDSCTHPRCQNCLKWALQWREKELGIREGA